MSSHVENTDLEIKPLSCARSFAKFTAVTAGIFSIFVGGVLSYQNQCFLSSSIQILIGFIIVAIEEPTFCFICVKEAQIISLIVNERPLRRRFLIYIIMGFKSIFLCPSIASLYAGFWILVTVLIYCVVEICEIIQNKCKSACMTDSNDSKWQTQISIIGLEQAFKNDGNQAIYPVTTDEEIDNNKNILVGAKEILTEFDHKAILPAFLEVIDEKTENEEKIEEKEEIEKDEKTQKENKDEQEKKTEEENKESENKK